MTKPIYPNFGITIPKIKEMLTSKEISDGMIPRIDSCINALSQGVESAHLLDGRIPHVTF